MFEEHSSSFVSPYLYNGKELDRETGLYYYGARYYDPKVSIFVNVDPLVEQTMTSYAYVNNNPVMLVDPTGMIGEDWVKRERKGGTEYFFDPDVQGKNATESKHGKGSHVENGSSLVGKSNQREKYRYTFNSDGSYSKDGSIVNSRTKTEGGSTIYQYCSNCLDPQTLYQQFGGIGGLTYPGGDNPKTYGGKDDYSFVPSSLVEFPAIQHDLAYDKLGITGASGLLMDRSAISADWTFVNQHIFLSQSGLLSPTDRFKSDLLGFGLGVAATPKTLLNFVLPTPKYSYPYTPEQRVLINIGMSNFR